MTVSIQHADSQFIHKFAYVAGSSPGAVGAGKGWIDTSSSPYKLKVRNDANSAWVIVGLSSSDLVTIGNLNPDTPGLDNLSILQRKAVTWTHRTLAQLKADLALNLVVYNEPNSGHVEGYAILNRDNHTGTQLSSTISNFNSLVDTSVGSKVKGIEMTDDLVFTDFLGESVYTDLLLGLDYLGVYLYRAEIFHNTDAVDDPGGGVKFKLRSTTGVRRSIGGAKILDTLNNDDSWISCRIDDEILRFPTGNSVTTIWGTLFMPSAPESLPGGIFLEAGKGISNVANLTIKAGSNLTVIKLGMQPPVIIVREGEG